MTTSEDMRSKKRSAGGPSTRAIHAVTDPGALARTVGPPIQRGSTVLMPDAAALYDKAQVTYGRAGLAAQRTLAEALAELEGGVACQLFPSGLAAVTGALLAVLKAGDEILVADCCYQPTRRFCDKVLRKLGIAVRYFPPRATAEDIFSLGGPALRLVLLETPGSLTFEMQDVAEIARLARQRGVLTVMDNTWAAGLLFKPLAHGVDISVQALTKYVCGHSDVFLGAACAREPAMVHALDEAIWNFGWAVSPDDAYQGLRGLRTLPTRMARHGESALTVARWLAEQPEVTSMLHPAFEDSPDHALWRRDYTGANGLFSFTLRLAPERAVNAFLDALKLFGLGFSWGGFESLAISSDDQLPLRRFKPDLPGPLIRLHIGLEDAVDLIGDLRAGLDEFNAA
jgi:cystathionine beta-lyase